MFSSLRSLFSPHVQPMNVMRIYHKHILHNFHYLQSLQPDSALFPVLKSNAYGHGIKEMVKILKRVDAPYVVVDSFPEYQIVRDYSRFSILVLGETLSENYRHFDFSRTAFAVYNKETLHVLGKIGKKIKIHLFLNTGMNREGIDADQLEEILEIIKGYKSLVVEGVMSHLYGADSVESISDLDREVGGEMTSIEKQIALFKDMYYQILEYGHAPRWRHIGNSAGILKIKGDFFNAWRPGIALYGYSPLQKDDPLFSLGEKLKPALSVTSRVISLHKVWPGDGVSYNHKYVFSDRELVGTIPFGYAEGLPRNLSGKIFFRIGKRLYPQIGTICMNLCSFLAEDKVSLGDEVEVISVVSDAENSLQSLVDAGSTIVYEDLVRLDKGMRREIV